MPTRCVAGRCSATYSDGVNFFKFPKDEARRRLWIKQVSTTPAKWKPSKTSMLCSKHFSDDCFEPQVALAASFGIVRRKKLKPSAIPTIFDKGCRPQASKPRKPSENREHARVGIYTDKYYYNIIYYILLMSQLA